MLTVERIRDMWRRNRDESLRSVDVESVLTFARAIEAECGHAVTVNREVQLQAALDDCASALRYIRQTHGELSGVGFDRCEEAARRLRSPDPQQGEPLS